MKHLITLLFLVLVAQGINANNKKERKSISKNNWCIDTNDVLTWILVDKKGSLFVYTKEELHSIPDSTYKQMQKYMRVKQVTFIDAGVDDNEKDSIN